MSEKRGSVSQKPVLTAAIVFDFLRSYAIMVVLIFMIIIASFMSKSFFTVNNLLNIMRQVSVIGIIAFGTTFVIIAGLIDLSVGSIVSLAGVICISIINSFSADIPAILAALAAGTLIGLVNGLVISGINGRVGESFMITYGMQTAVAAIALLYTGGSFLAGRNTGGIHDVLGKDFGPIAVFVLIAVVLHFVLKKTAFGRIVYFIGGNTEATKMSGINVRRYRVIIFMIAGFLAALASIVLASRVNAASPVSGKGYELDAIAAVVVGGTSMAGGRGGIINSIIGVIIIGILGNALNILNVTANPQLVIRGVIIVLAVALDVLNKRRKIKGV